MQKGAQRKFFLTVHEALPQNVYSGELDVRQHLPSGSPHQNHTQCDTE